MRLAARLFLLALAAAPALAQGPVAGAAAFSVHDLDADGALSVSEYAALREHCRAHRDARGRARCNPARLLPFEVLDANGDGRVTEAEMLDALGARHRYGRAWSRE
jgi:hypothetical protein